MLAAVVTFAAVLDFDFLYVVDPAAVVHNPAVTGAGSARAADWVRLPGFTAPSPVTIATFTLEAVFLGGHEHAAWSPRTFHGANLALHVLAVGLLAALALRLGLGAMAAGTGGLLLALHPAVAEPVAWISGRPYLLAAVLSLGALHLWWGRRSSIAVAVALLGAATHPAALLLPMAFVALDHLRGGTRRGRASDLLLVAIAVVMATAVLGAMSRPGGGGAGAGGAGDRLLRAALVLGTRVSGLLWPATLGTLPGQPAGAAAIAAGVLGATVAVLVGVILVVGRRAAGPSRRSAAWTGLLLAALFHVPTSGLFVIERPWNAVHLYLPLAGLALAAAAVLDLAGVRVAAAAAAAVLALAAGSTSLVGAYASSDALVTASKRMIRGSSEELMERARAARSVGRLQEAMRFLLELEERHPDHRRHLGLKGDILRAAGQSRTAYWAYLFAVRSGDHGACDRLIDDTLAHGWTPGPAEFPELRLCLGRTLPRIFSDGSTELREQAKALGRTVGHPFLP